MMKSKHLLTLLLLFETHFFPRYSPASLHPSPTYDFNETTFMRPPSPAASVASHNTLNSAKSIKAESDATDSASVAWALAGKPSISSESIQSIIQSGSVQSYPSDSSRWRAVHITQLADLHMPNPPNSPAHTTEASGGIRAPIPDIAFSPATSGSAHYGTAPQHADSNSVGSERSVRSLSVINRPGSDTVGSIIMGPEMSPIVTRVLLGSPIISNALANRSISLLYRSNTTAEFDNILCPAMRLWGRSCELATLGQVGLLYALFDKRILIPEDDSARLSMLMTNLRVSYSLADFLIRIIKEELSSGIAASLHKGKSRLGAHPSNALHPYIHRFVELYSLEGGVATSFFRSVFLETKDKTDRLESLKQVFAIDDLLASFLHEAQNPV